MIDDHCQALSVVLATFIIIINDCIASKPRIALPGKLLLLFAFELEHFVSSQITEHSNHRGAIESIRTIGIQTNLGNLGLAIRYPGMEKGWWRARPVCAPSALNLHIALQRSLKLIMIKSTSLLPCLSVSRSVSEIKRVHLGQRQPVSRPERRQNRLGHVVETTSASCTVICGPADTRL